MNFEPFNHTSKAHNTVDGYTVIRQKRGDYFSGQINFGGKMRDKLNLSQYKRVETYRDDKEMIVALRFNNDPLSESNRSLRRNGTSLFMSSVSFVELMVEKFGYPVSKNMPYESLDNGLVVLKKTNPTNE